MEKITHGIKESCLKRIDREATSRCAPQITRGPPSKRHATILDYTSYLLHNAINGTILRRVKPLFRRDPQNSVRCLARRA